MKLGISIQIVHTQNITYIVHIHYIYSKKHHVQINYTQCFQIYIFKSKFIYLYIYVFIYLYIHERSFLSSNSESAEVSAGPTKGVIFILGMDI